MRKFQKIFLILSIAISFAFLIPSLTKAGNGGNVFGLAWSENIGWISFNNCFNPSTSYCYGSDYGTNYQGSTWSGYAWSDNIGWISFNPSDWSECPPSGSCSSYASYNNSTANTWVWGRALNGIGSLDTESGGNYYDGWIAIYGKDSAGNSFGPNIDSAYTVNGGIMNGYYAREVTYSVYQSARIAGSGYAWGGNVIGWIDMAITDYNHDTELYVYVPKLMLTASPQVVDAGNTVTTLTWSSPNGTVYNSCTGLGGSSDWNNTSQSAITSANPTRSKSSVTVPSSPTKFQIKCTTASGLDVYAETSVTITNNSCSGGSCNKIKIDASPTVVASGGTTKLSWYSPTGSGFVGSCTASGGGTDWNGTQSKPDKTNPIRSKSGVSVPSSPTTTFKITCPISNGGSVSDSVDVYVNSSASNLSISVNPPIAASGDKISLTYNSSSNTTYASCMSIMGGTDWNNVTQTALSSSNAYSKTVNNIVVPIPNPPSPFVVYGIQCTTGSGLIDMAFTTVALKTNTTTGTLSLIASPTTVGSGGTTNLYWSSPTNTNFTNCNATGGGSDWNGQILATPSTTVPIQSQSSVSVPSATTIYNIGCVTTSGSIVYASAMVTQGSGAKLVLSASPTAVNTGGTTSLMWSSPTGTSFASCTGRGGDTNWNKSQTVPTGTASKTLSSVGVPTYPKTIYFLDCTTSGGVTETATAEVTISHTIKVNLSASPAAVLSGNSSTISWTVDNATPSTTCTATTPSGWTTQTGSNGSQSITNITTGKTYTLNCSDSYTTATDSGSVDIGILKIDSFSSSGACINTGVDARLNWTSSNATGCTIKYFSGGWSMGAMPTKTFSASSTGSNYVTTGAGKGDYTLYCSNGSVNTAESSPITVTECPPTFSVSSKITCATGNPQEFAQATPPFGDYTAKVTFVAVPRNNFSNNISLSITQNLGLPSSAFSWTSASATQSGSYTKDLTITLNSSSYATFISSLTNKYGVIKIQGTGTQSGKTTTITGSYGICGSGGSNLVPVFRPI